MANPSPGTAGEPTRRELTAAFLAATASREELEEKVEAERRILWSRWLGERGDPDLRRFELAVRAAAAGAAPADVPTRADGTIDTDALFNGLVKQWAAPASPAVREPTLADDEVRALRACVRHQEGTAALLELLLASEAQARAELDTLRASPAVREAAERPQVMLVEIPVLDQFTVDGEWEWVLTFGDHIVTIPTDKYDRDEAAANPGPLALAERIAATLAAEGERPA